MNHAGTGVMLKSSIISLAACLAGFTVVACTPDQRAVERELAAAQDALMAVDLESREYVTVEVRAIQESVDSATARIERGQYGEALAVAREARTRATDLPNTVVERKAELDTVWAALRDSLPLMLQQIEAQVKRLSSTRPLPAGVSTAQVADAKATLQALTGEWAEAVRESEDGKLPTAVNRGQSVRARAMELMQSLGLWAT